MGRTLCSMTYMNRVTVCLTNGTNNDLVLNKRFVCLYSVTPVQINIKLPGYNRVRVCVRVCVHVCVYVCSGLCFINRVHIFYYRCQIANLSQIMTHSRGNSSEMVLSLV